MIFERVFSFSSDGRCPAFIDEEYTQLIEICEWEPSNFHSIQVLSLVWGDFRKFLIFGWYDGFSNHRGTDGVDDLSFVTGAIWHQRRGVRDQVRATEPPRKNRPPPGSGGGKSSNDSKDAAARKLTSQMKKDIESGAELLELLDGVVDDPIFNKFHASAAYHSLATKWKGGLTPSDKASPVLPRLDARVQRMTEEGQVEPRTVANVLYSLGKLSDDLEVPEGLLMALVKSLGEKAGGMEPQGLSNSLLACVQLKGVAPEVLTALPKLAAQISIKAKDMIPQDLSNNLWAFAHLKDDACHEDVAKIVAALVGQIPDKANGMKPQELSNSLWAAAQLKDIAPDVKEIVPAIVAQIQDKANGMNPQDLSNNLRAAVQLKDVAPEVKEIVPAIVAQIPDKANGMKPQELSNSLWASARLKDDACDDDSAKIVDALVRQIPDKAKDMIPQALSNILWASARLKDIAPDVKEIVPAIVAQIQDKANGMNPQDLSNNLLAAARLKDDAPEVLQMVPALLEEIPRNQAGLKAQEICNCLEALVLLQDSVREVNDFLAAPPNSNDDFVGFTASQFSTLLPTLKGKDLEFAVPVVVWACAKVNLHHEKLMVSASQRLESTALKTFPDWGLCALLWSYDVLDTDGQFAKFKQALESERVRRGLSDSDVLKSQSGYFGWNRTKG